MAAATATAGSDLSDGPVLSLINKRLRALRKKHNRILQMEESIAQGKPINKEQEDVLRSKPAVVALIDELDKLRQPLSAALDEELDLALRHRRVADDAAAAAAVAVDNKSGRAASDDNESSGGGSGSAVEDLLRLLYFGTLFDWKPQSEFASTMLTRSHERECCLTYDTVTDDATEMLGQRDLDLISMLGGLVLSRPLGSALSHQNALQRCVEHAKLWLANSDCPIDQESDITYAALRERLNKIMASHYFTRRPEIKAPGEVAAAAGNYASFQMESVSVPVQVEGPVAQYQQLDEESGQFEGRESGDNTSVTVEEPHKEELEMENPTVDPIQQEQDKPQVEVELNEQDVELKEPQHIPRRSNQNQRSGRGGAGGSGGRKGHFNVRGGRNSGRGGGGYQNGRNQYYDQPGNYYPRNYYNSRGRGGRASGGGGQSYYNYGPAVQVGHAPENVGSGS